MQALHWDGHELRFEPAYPSPGATWLLPIVTGKHEVSLATIVIHEINVSGSRCGPFPDALDALEKKRVVVTPLIEAICLLKDGLDAVQRAAQLGARKIMLRP